LSALATIPLWSPFFQGLLHAMGVLLAWLYDSLHSYGFAIIVLTVLIRLVLLPLGVKQIKSMQVMQALAPKVKEIQKKFKTNKQKQTEETMKLYHQYGASPFGGIGLMLLQFPLLIAVYALIRPPVVDASVSPPVVANNYNHLPPNSTLYHLVIHHETTFLGLNLQCSAKEAGSIVTVNDSKRNPLPTTGEAGVKPTIDCGSGASAKIPYGLLILVMVGTMFYQQRQMQRASPPGSQTAQTQALTNIMPIMFAGLGILFPAGLMIYWITTNLLLIGQQAVLLHLGHIGPDALERRAEEMKNKPPKRQGFISKLQEQAESERKRRDAQQTKRALGDRKPSPNGRARGSSGTVRRQGQAGRPKGQQPRGPRGKTGREERPDG
jgi:YidC/Oxa1 family membrane protein insertase